MTSRMPTWARALLVIGALGAVLCTAFVAWVFIAFSGGLDDVLDVRDPAPDDRRVVEARERSEERLAAELAGITGTEPSGASADCEEGQHNWKIDDPYDLLCTQSTATAVPLGADPTTDLLQLHYRLVADGWTPSGVEAGLEDRSSLERMVVEYGPADLPAASYRRDNVGLVVETAHAGEPAPYGWPGAAPEVESGRLTALVLLREEYFSG